MVHVLVDFGVRRRKLPRRGADRICVAAGILEMMDLDADYGVTTRNRLAD